MQCQLIPENEFELVDLSPSHSELKELIEAEGNAVSATPINNQLQTLQKILSEDINSHSPTLTKNQEKELQQKISKYNVIITDTNTLTKKYNAAIKITHRPEREKQLQQLEKDIKQYKTNATKLSVRQKIIVAVSSVSSAFCCGVVGFFFGGPQNAAVFGFAGGLSVGLFAGIHFHTANKKEPITKARVAIADAFENECSFVLGKK